MDTLHLASHIRSRSTLKASNGYTYLGGEHVHTPGIGTVNFMVFTLYNIWFLQPSILVISIACLNVVYVTHKKLQPFVKLYHLQKAYKSAFLVSFGVSLILHTYICMEEFFCLHGFGRRNARNIAT